MWVRMIRVYKSQQNNLYAMKSQIALEVTFMIFKISSEFFFLIQIFDECGWLGEALEKYFMSNLKLNKSRIILNLFQVRQSKKIRLNNF